MFIPTLLQNFLLHRTRMLPLCYSDYVNFPKEKRVYSERGKKECGVISRSLLC